MRPGPELAVPFARTPGRGRKRCEPRSVPALPTGPARPASPRGRTCCAAGGAREGSDKSSRRLRRARPHRDRAAAEVIGAPACGHTSADTPPSHRLAEKTTPKTFAFPPQTTTTHEVTARRGGFGRLVVPVTRVDGAFPQPQASAAKPQSPIVTFAAMIPEWATLKGKGKKSVQDMTTKTTAFVEWLEHDNMAEVTFEDGRDWRDEMIQDGDLSNQSISNYLKAVKALFSFAFEEGHIKDADGKIRIDDPMARVKYDPGDGKKRADFTMVERESILLIAREADMTSPEIKWLTWLSAFQLTRTSEIADIHTRDFFIEDGIWTMQIQIKNRSKDQKIKTEQSHRKMALHSAVLDEGFIEFLQAAGDGPLFASLSLDSYGKRAGQASNLTSNWLRDVMGIEDPAKPFYSLRHSGITDLRIARTPNGEIAVKDRIELYLTAHGKRDEHGRYGEYPVSELKAAIEWVRNPLRAQGGERPLPSPTPSKTSDFLRRATTFKVSFTPIWDAEHTPDRGGLATSEGG